MYELVKVTDNSYYIECPAKIGLYVDDEGGAILIDAGGDKDGGKKALKHIDANGWKLKAIINTHSNADHIGGNQVIINRTGAVAYTTKNEGAINAWPQFEPTILYGGYPCKALRNKFLMAKPTQFTDIDEMDMPEGMEYFRLPGHFIDMIGVKTPDDVYFMADCVSAPEILDKYKVGYIYDVGAYLDTLDMIEDWKGVKFVPCHTPACDDMKELCHVNRENVLGNIELIKDLCRDGCSAEELIQKVFTHYGLAMDFNQYVLVGGTIRSYCSYMADKGMLGFEFADNRLVWRTL